MLSFEAKDHGPGMSLWPRYISLLCHKACERSLILMFLSWRSQEKNLKFSGYTMN